MFSQLTERMTKVIKTLTGQSRLTEDNIKQALREVRIALLEADVALPVIKAFLEPVQQQALGHEVLGKINPGQLFIKIVNDELIKLMGSANEALQLNTQPPAIILMAGLQGSGKTTSSAKLAYYLKNQAHKNVMLASTDIYRPAAIQQLEILAQQIGVKFFPSNDQQSPILIAKNACLAAKQQIIDVLIIDTAGRLHINTDMMDEIKAIHATTQPIETLFVIDSMTGQDAAKTAQAFHSALPLTGVILSKTDGDARGGAALSVRYLTGKPIKFIGIGEKIDALAPFHPERMASRILGMGDILSLVEQAQQVIDQKTAQKMAKKLQKGHFDLTDYRQQLSQMGKMGGISNLLEKLPTGLPQGLTANLNDKMFIQASAIIDSMTPKERSYPDIIRGGRKKRIAAGSGTTIQDVNRMLKQFYQMQKMMKKIGSKGGMSGMMRHLKQMLPKGFSPSQTLK